MKVKELKDKLDLVDPEMDIFIDSNKARIIALWCDGKIVGLDTVSCKEYNKLLKTINKR